MTTITKSIKAHSIILVDKQVNDETKDVDYIVQINNFNFKSEVLPCTESFYALIKQAQVVKDKTHTFTLYMNKQGEVYNYDKEIKATYKFMETEEEKEAKDGEANNTSMIVTYDMSSHEVNLLRQFTSITDKIKAQIIEFVTKNINDLHADDILPGNIIISEIRERGNIIALYVEK